MKYRRNERAKVAVGDRPVVDEDYPGMIAAFFTPHCKSNVAQSINDVNRYLHTSYTEKKGSETGDANNETNWAVIDLCRTAHRLDQTCPPWKDFLNRLSRAANAGLDGVIILHDSSITPSTADFMPQILRFIDEHGGLQDFNG